MTINIVGLQLVQRIGERRIVGQTKVVEMKAILGICAAAALTGCCTYDYYKGGVKYTQSGPDCVYQFQEDGGMFSRYEKQYKENKKVVYRDTSCAKLYANDSSSFTKAPERRVYVNAPESACGRSACGQSSRKFVIVPVEY